MLLLHLENVEIFAVLLIKAVAKMNLNVCMSVSKDCIFDIAVQWCCDVADRLTPCPCPRPRQCSIHPCTMCTFAQHYVFSSSSDSSKYPLQSAVFSPSPCEHNSSHVSLLPGTKNTAGAMPGLGVRGVDRVA